MERLLPACMSGDATREDPVALDRYALKLPRASRAEIDKVVEAGDQARFRKRRGGLGIRSVDRQAKWALVACGGAIVLFSVVGWLMISRVLRHSRR
ncbi:MAG: hypothetical protein U0992_07735 [Planctomycetaceae bacterium]